MSQLGSVPLMGTEAAKPTDETPGIAASLSTMLFCMRTTVVESRTTVSGMERRITCRDARIGEAWIDVAHRQEGADHQHRADQQHQRHGNLGHHQQVTAALSVAAGARRARSSKQGHALPRGCIAQRRYRTEKQTGKHRENQREDD